MELQRALRDDVGVEAVHELAARHVERAGEGAERAVQPDGGRGVALLVGDRGPRDDPRGAGRVEARGGRDPLGVAAGDRGHPFERELVHPPPERVEAHRPALREVPVVEPFVEDHLEPAEAHRGVRPGAKREPDVGELRVLGAARVQHDELRAVLLGGADRVVDRGPAMFAGVVAEEDDAAGARIVGVGEPSVHHAVDRRGVAGAQGDPRDPVRGPEEVHEPAPGAVLGLGVPLAGGDGKALRPVAVHHRAEPLRDLVEGLVPGHAPPAALAPRPGALEGVEHPVRVGEPRRGVDPLHADVRAERTRVERLDPDHLAVLDVHLHLAVDVAARAEDALRFHGRSRR